MIIFTLNHNCPGCAIVLPDWRAIGSSKLPDATYNLRDRIPESESAAMLEQDCPACKRHMIGQVQAMAQDGADGEKPETIYKFMGVRELPA